MNTSPGEITDTISVTIKQLDGSTFNVQIAATGTVGQLKQAIQRERDVLPERQRLIYRAQELKNDGTLLSDYGVVDQSILHIVIRPLGSVPANNYNPNPSVVVNMPQNNAGGYDFNPLMYNAGNAERAPPVNRNVHHDINVLQIVKLCRFVRIFAVMDFIFLILFGLTLSFVFFFSWQL